MFDRWNALDQQLSQSDLVLSRVRETRSAMKQICNRVGNWKKAMAVYQRREIVIQVEKAIAVDIEEIGAFPA
ncbi:hypothetical protein FHT72_001753 [Rhizobium sp. BK077]|nr:hypothetical protein [Rhizobium sp. BK112]MBB3367282.1 hypothetical protein [Rhizobium sp. BK077]MBB4178702.1 hypothetical protein [Rhizobium sp. BK109]MBB4213820.1 hypothetical protein [Rhizobium sp. BK212]